MGDERTYSGDDLLASGQTPDWVWILNGLQTRFRTGSFEAGLRLVNAIGEAAEEANHHPDLDLRYPHLNVRLSSHDVGAVTQRDVDLARQISELAAGVGIAAAPADVVRVELALDTWDQTDIRPFWQAVLGSTAGADDEVSDAAGNMPTLWFQETDRHDEPRQRFHLDVWVAPDVAPQRIEEALAAGGVLVSADAAPSFTVLADAQGNKACICTHAARAR